MANLYPVFLDLSNKRCLVAGGGLVGERKVYGLLEAEARVVLVSPEITKGLRELSEKGQIVWIARKFLSVDLTDCFLVIAATNYPQVNVEIASEAQKRGLLFCGVDSDSQGNFLVPSVVRRGDLQLAISTGGASPAYSRLIREDLEQMFGEEHALFLAHLKKWRQQVMQQFPDDEERRRKIWQTIVNRDVLALVAAGHWDQIEERVSACLSLSSA